MAEPQPQRRVRGRLTAFVAAHQLAWDITFGALAVGYLAAGIAADAGNDRSNALLLVLAALFLGLLLDATVVGRVRHSSSR